MSQEKAQLIAPIGHFTVPGLNVSGVVTATSFSGNCTGTASSITKGASLVVGVMTATSFVGDVTGNVTGIGSNTDNLDVGIVTATSFAGNFTGIGSGLTGTPNVVAGVVTATKFVGNTPGTVSKLADGTNINVGVVTATKFVGNTSGLAGGISAAQNINVGVLTATGGLYGDGSGLTGAGSTAYIRQDVTAQSGTTTINLNDGNIIYLTHSNNTTIAFSNVKTADDVTIIRTLTDNTITWPAAITWNGGSAPTLRGANSYSLTGQVFNLVTYNGGTNWYGYEEVNNDSSQPYEMYSWGVGSYGRLGLNSQTQRSSPTQIPGTTWLTLFRGDGDGDRSISSAIKSDGTLWVWGPNAYGQMGQNNTSYYSSPIQIPGTTWSGGGYKRFGFGGIKTDGTLWVWGAGDWGMNASNNQTRYSSPVQVPGTIWKNIGGGHLNVFATKTDGTLWCWGNGHWGKLGNNKNQNDSGFSTSSPAQIPGTTWAVVAGNYNGGAATKTDGTFWAWGYNNKGQLGQNNTTNYSSPTQVPGTTWGTTTDTLLQAPEVQGSIKTDGTLWMWGNNENGELGQNNTTDYSSPKQIPGTEWKQINFLGDSSNGAMLATKTDGTMWSWGRNELGNLGQNTVVTYSSPVQIPGTDWGVIGSAGVGGLALKTSS